LVDSFSINVATKEGEMKNMGFWKTLWTGLTMLGDGDFQHDE